MLQISYINCYNSKLLYGISIASTVTRFYLLWLHRLNVNSLVLKLENRTLSCQYMQYTVIRFLNFPSSLTVLIKTKKKNDKLISYITYLGLEKSFFYFMLKLFRKEIFHEKKYYNYFINICYSSYALYGIDGLKFF